MYEIRVYLDRDEQADRDGDLIFHSYYKEGRIPFDTNGMSGTEILNKLIDIVSIYLVSEQINTVGDCMLKAHPHAVIVSAETMNFSAFKEFFIENRKRGDGDGK